jgi:hypothetical protein
MGQLPWLTQNAGALPGKNGVSSHNAMTSPTASCR